MKKWFLTWRQSEQGQSIVEFAIIIPILILLVMLPVDYFRYINTRMLLCSAASEGIGQLTYASIDNGTVSSDFINTLNTAYGDRLDIGRVTISTMNYGAVTKQNYTYYVYSSDKADPLNYWNQFDQRPASYQCAEVEIQLTYTIEPLTFWGSMYLGDKINITTPVYTRSVYAGGYTP